MDKQKRFSAIGIVARLKPLHNGAELMLEAACENADHVIIGIGSSNRYDLRNPFTAEESEAMVHACLQPKYTNYKIIYVPDFGHLDPAYRDGQKWRCYIKENFSPLDAFISGNDYVVNLLKEDYQIIHPASLIPRKMWIKLHATQVRYEMARGNNWKQFVPARVAEYFETNKLVDRFRREFGLQTLQEVHGIQEAAKEKSALEEQKHSWGE